MLSSFHIWTAYRITDRLPRMTWRLCDAGSETRSGGWFLLCSIVSFECHRGDQWKQMIMHLCNDVSSQADGMAWGFRIWMPFVLILTNVINIRSGLLISLMCSIFGDILTIFISDCPWRGQNSRNVPLCAFLRSLGAASTGFEQCVWIIAGGSS